MLSQSTSQAMYQRGFFFPLLDIEFYSFPMISDFVEVVADCILCFFFFGGEFATGDAGA